MKLYIRQKVFKITDHYPIRDEDGNTVYQVDQDFKLAGFKVHVSDAKGNERFVIERKLLRLLPEFHIRFADGGKVVMKSRPTLLHRKIDVTGTGEEIEFTGDILSHHFEMTVGGEPAATMRKKYLSIGDCYEIDVYREDKADIVVALMIAADHLMDQSEEDDD